MIWKKNIFGLGVKLILKRSDNDRALFRVDVVPGAIANDGKDKINDISWCVPSFDPINDNRIIVQKGLNQNYNIDFSFYERKTSNKNVPNATNFLFHLGMDTVLKNFNKY